MRKIIFATLIILPSLLLSACGQSNSTSLQTSQNSIQTQPNSNQTNSTQTQKNSASSNSKSNIDQSPDSSATKTIELFYQYLNEGNYKSAVNLLGPQLRFEGSPNMIKYLKNIKKNKIIRLDDISNNPGPIEPNYNDFYKIKVFYGEIDYEVQDPNLVKGLAGINYRKIIVIKQSEQSPWLIDTNEATPPR